MKWRCESGEGIGHIAEIQRRKHAESFLEIKSAMKKVAAEIILLLDAISKVIMKLEAEPR